MPQVIHLFRDEDVETEDCRWVKGYREALFGGGSTLPQSRHQWKKWGERTDTRCVFHSTEEKAREAEANPVSHLTEDELLAEDVRDAKLTVERRKEDVDKAKAELRDCTTRLNAAKRCLTLRKAIAARKT